MTFGFDTTGVTELVRCKEKFHFALEKCTPEEIKMAAKTGVSIQSGKGTGKDAEASWLILWFLICFTNSKIPCTAQTGHQLKDVLWSEEEGNTKKYHLA